jgi:hypothetical protein
MRKTFIGINTLTAVEQPAYASHLNLFYRLGKHFPDDHFGLFTPRRMSIDRMRNSLAKLAIEGEYDYIAFIDDDVIVPNDMFDKMFAADVDIIAGWTLIRGYPFDNMFFTFGDERALGPAKGQDRDGKTLDVDAIGFSTALIKVDLLRKIPPPWFVTGPTNTEDIYFCLKARQHVPNCTIKVDKSIETGHILGPEIIGPWNVREYKKYVEECDPLIMGSGIPYIEKNGDRGQEYLDMVEGALPARILPFSPAGPEYPEGK